MIQTIIFDFGGVLLDLDFDRTFHQLGKLLGVELDSGLSADHPLTEHYLAYEQGLINDETLIWNIQKLARKPTEPRLIVNAWNAMLLGWNPQRFAMLERLRKDYRLILLSNTNHMHISWVHRDLQRQHQISEFETKFFDKVYYSYKIHLRKPDTSIYDYVSRNGELDLSTTLFIDDSPANVLAARERGWKAVQHFPAKEDITVAIDKYLQLR